SVHDEQLNAVTAQGTRRRMPALGIESVTPISQERFLELQHSVPHAHSFVRGPRIGLYDSTGIPEYVEIDGKRYDYIGLAPLHAPPLDPKRYFVTDGLLFEHRAR